MSVDLLQGLFQSQLDGGVWILSLPTKEILAAVCEQQAVGDAPGPRL